MMNAIARLMNGRLFLSLLLVTTFLITGCEDDETRGKLNDTIDLADNDSMDVDTSAVADGPELVTPVTLPILSVFLADSAFVRSIAEVLALTDAEIDSLRAVASGSVAEMYGRGSSDEEKYGYSTGQARTNAEEAINRIIGPERGKQLVDLIRLRWNGVDERGEYAAIGQGSGGDSGAVATAARTQRGGVPTDTRIVVNIPARRMDLFDKGTLVASYSIAIGYPEFPLPTGVRRATEVIFNPTWTPPDESWVSGSKTAKAGKTVPAGDRNNPLGIAKIPIGLPSLIHGGKPAAKLGTFGSHGCVGLSDEQMRAFVTKLGEAAGTPISDTDVKGYGADRSTTETVTLAAPIPVELRYETIVVQDGELIIYRDVYDYNTNTEEYLRSVLALYGVAIDQLDEATRTKVNDALARMARDAQGQTDAQDPTGGDTGASVKEKATVTRQLTGTKEIVIAIPALAGKGYPKMAAATKGVAAR